VQGRLVFRFDVGFNFGAHENLPTSARLD